MDNFKPMLACDWFEEKIKFPCIIQPKVDGVHSVNRHGKLLGRSLKPHDNLFITQQYSKPEFHGFCGEMYSTELGDRHPASLQVIFAGLKVNQRLAGSCSIT